MEDNSIQDILTLLADRVKLEPKDTEEFVEAMFGIIRDALTRDRMVKIKGLGTFKVVDVDSRESVSVNSGERFTIEGHGKVAFIPDATMKELVNKPFSQFETVVINEGVTFEDDEADTGGKEAEEAVETMNTPSEAPSQDKPQGEDKEEPTPAPVVEKAEEGHSSVETYVVDDPTMNTDEDEDAQEDDEPHWTEIPMEGDDYANASRKKRFLRRLAAFKSSRSYKIAMHSAVTLLLMGGSMYVGFLLFIVW